MAETIKSAKDGAGNPFNMRFTDDGSGNLNPRSTLMDANGTPISISNPIATAKPQVTMTDHSGTLTTGGTAQTVMAADSSRKGWDFQNLGSDDVYLNTLGSAAAVGGAGCIKVSPGQLYEPAVITTQAISAISATSSIAYTLRSW